MHTCTHICAHARTRACVKSCMAACTNACIYAHTDTCIQNGGKYNNQDVHGKKKNNEAKNGYKTGDNRKSYYSLLHLSCRHVCIRAGVTTRMQEGVQSCVHARVHMRMHAFACVCKSAPVCVLVRRLCMNACLHICVHVRTRVCRSQRGLAYTGTIVLWCSILGWSTRDGPFAGCPFVAIFGCRH